MLGCTSGEDDGDLAAGQAVGDGATEASARARDDGYLCGHAHKMSDIQLTVKM